MAPFFSLVRDVNPSTSLWAMRLRVVRAYELPAFGNQPDSSSYEIIFHDKESERIHATVKATTLKCLSTKPMEGHIYAVKDFLVTEDRMKFKTTDNPLKIIFLRKTKIQEVFDESFPKSTFIFTPFNKFATMTETPQFKLFDVIGKLKSCQISPTLTANGKRIEFEIEDMDQNQLSCTLWDNYCDALTPYIDHTSSENVVVIIQFGRMSVFGGNVKFSNTFNATKVYVNGNDAEIEKYNLKLKDAGIGSSKIETFHSTSALALADEFKTGKAVVKNIAEIISCTEPGIYWVPATIMELEILSDWFYLACKFCSKKLTPVNGVYFCSKCIRTIKDGIYRYKLQVSVMDKSGCAQFILWDKECIELIGKSAVEIKDANEEAFDYVPKEIENALTERSGLFKVQVKDGDNQREFVTYSVAKITLDPILITKYSDKYIESKGKEIQEDDDIFRSDDCNTVDAHNMVEYTCEKEFESDGDTIMVKNNAVIENVELGASKKRKRIVKKEK